MIELSTIWAIGALAESQLLSLPGNLTTEASLFGEPQRLPATFAGPAIDAERAGLPVTVRNNIAVISLRGVMLKSYPWPSSYVASTAHVRMAVRAARLDESIEHILIQSDTPGGDVRGMHELGDEITAAAQDKNVVVQIEGTLASAGYHVAAGANSIYASHRMNSVGSIGVRTVLWDTSKMYDEAGIRVIKVDTGEHKSTGLAGVPVTEAQQAEVQRVVDQLYDEFLAVIVRGRGISESDLKELADGRTWFAHEAEEFGLIDGIQSLEQTMAELAKNSSAGGRTRAESGMSIEAADALFAEIS